MSGSFPEQAFGGLDATLGFQDFQAKFPEVEQPVQRINRSNRSVRRGVPSTQVDLGSSKT
jgi:hypothetical protein